MLICNLLSEIVRAILLKVDYLKKVKSTTIVLRNKLTIIQKLKHKYANKTIKKSTKLPMNVS